MTEVSDEILQAIPHREPFLFIDRIVSSGERTITTARGVREDEDFFRGHYPGNPLMPGVLICEAMFQTGALLLARSLGSLDNKAPVLTRVKEVKFRNPVRPGDEMEITVDWIETVAPAHFLRGSVTAAGKKIASAEFAVALLEMRQE